MEILEETRNVAEEAFPKCNSYITLRDGLGTIFEDDLFGDLYPNLEQPPESPARLAMVILMQYMENLPDAQAAEAVLSRIDWKYLLNLKLSDPGFDSSVLSELRLRLTSIPCRCVSNVYNCYAGCIRVALDCI